MVRCAMRLIFLLMAMSAGCFVTDSRAGGVLRVSIDPGQAGRTIDVGRLVGGNVALWYEPGQLAGSELASQLANWKPGILRMPGGSWSDEFFWNGNGVRKGEEFDLTKRKEGRWQVDFSDYAPGFHLSSVDGELSDFHGNVDVKALHEFIRKQGAETIVTVNAGTGTPEMAAEWVRWANKKQGYAVRYWEVGNELDGEWELGHFGRDGKAVDGDEYARRFLAFAKAMKAVDPEIKVGGPACSSDELKFVETLIREAGETLDFVSFHTYPVLGGKRTDAQRFAQADDAAAAVKRIRGWVKQHHPQRLGQIEVGVTEWHKQVMETRDTVDLASGLWACLFVGALAESGADFANQWDFYSDVGVGGHGLFGVGGKPVPRAVYHALALWSGHMHGEWLKVDGADESLRVFATKGRDDLAVMLVNTSRESAREVALDLGGKQPLGLAEAVRFSQREYFWSPHREEPEWSRSARETRVEIGEGGVIEVPAFCALVVKLPVDGHAGADDLVADAGEASLELLLPDKAPADLPVEGVVVVRRNGSVEPWQGTIGEVEITLDGGAVLDRKVVETGTSVGSFELRPSGAGRSTVRVTAGTLRAERTITWTAIRESEQVLWTFPDEGSIEGIETTYQLGVDRQVRPNQSVAVVSLQNSLAEPQKNTLMSIGGLPEGIDKARIGGVRAMLGASADLKCDDPKASIEVVVQSNHDHWILVGRVPLAELRGGWKDVKLRLAGKEALDAMAELYAVRLQLDSEAAVSGRIYVDDLGFVLRGEEN